MFLCGGTKSPAGGHIYENNCLESCFNCKNRFRPSLSRIDFFWKAPRPFCFVFFVLFFIFFCLSKFFGRLDPPPPPPDENSWIRAWNRLMDFRESWKRWSTHGPLKVCCFPVISAQGWIRVWVKIGRRDFFDFEITQLHTLCISYVEECGKK